MQYAHVLGVVHILILICLTWRSAGRLEPRLAQRFGAAYLLIWCNLVYTALLLSVFSRLRDVGLYFGLSVALATLVEVVLHWRKVSSGGAGEIVHSVETPVDRAIRALLSVILAVAVLASILICIHYIPNNWDSLTYRLSRAVFYLGQGNLMHLPNPVDPRLSIYPLNGSLLYLFLGIYQYGAPWWSIVTFAAWIFSGIGVYLVGRVLRASHAGALIASWVCLMTPNMLAQASSTNDEILSVAPMAVGLAFFLDWMATARRRNAILAGMGIALGCGTKLHWIFYSTFVVALAIAGIVAFKRTPSFRLDSARRLSGMFAAGTVALPLAISFIVCNLLSSGHITDQAFNNTALNQPFRLSLAGEVARITTAELFFSPVPDLVPPVHPEQRRSAYSEFNAFFMRCCFSHFTETVRPSPQGDVFKGPANPEGYHFNEYTVWLGFLPYLFTVAMVIAVRMRKLAWGSVVLLSSFFFWHITYSVQSQFVPTASVYYCVPATLAAAGLAPMWDLRRNLSRWSGSILMLSFLLVFGTDVLLDANLLVFGPLRNLQFLWRKDSPPSDMRPLDTDVVKAIQSAKQVYIPGTHWEVLYWNFMRFNFAARYTTGGDLNLSSPDTLKLLSVAPDVALGMLPARLPPGSEPALTFLGNEDYAPVFAQGDQIELKRPEASRYVLFQFTWSRDHANGMINGIEDMRCCIGLSNPAGAEIRYQLVSKATGERITSVWTGGAQVRRNLPSDTANTFDRILIDTRSKERPTTVLRTVYDLNQSVYVVERSEIYLPKTSDLETPAESLSVEVPGLAREPYSLGGKHYIVSWLRKSTQFSVFNLGRPISAMLEFRLATSGMARTAAFEANGRPLRNNFSVRKVFWINGADVIRLPVVLSPGENKFTLTSQEPPEVLGDGRAVCFLLIGEPVVMPLEKGSSPIDAATTCCGRGGAK